MIQAQWTQDFLAILEEAIADGIETTVIGTTGVSVTVTAVGSLAGVAIGATITGANIVNTPPTTIVAMDDAAHTITLSQAATGIGAGETLTIINPGPITDMKVGLYTNTPTLSVTSVLTDLTEPTYTGYARADVVPGPLRRNANGDFLVPFDLATFQPTDNVSLPQTAKGAFLMGTINGTPVLLGAGGLVPTFTFTSKDFGFDLEWENIVPNLLVFGGICSTC